MLRPIHVRNRRPGSFYPVAASCAVEGVARQPWTSDGLRECVGECGGRESLELPSGDAGVDTDKTVVGLCCCEGVSSAQAHDSLSRTLLTL